MSVWVADFPTDVIDAPSEALRSLFTRLDQLVPLDREDERALLSLPAEVRHYGARSRLVDPQIETDSCYLLVSAFAHKRKFLGGSQRVVAINLPGEVVNVETALKMSTDYAAEVFRAGEVAIIPADVLRELIFTRPALARGLWMMGQREAAIYRQWLVNNEQRPLRRRVTHLLCELAERLDSDGERPLLPVSADEIARALGSAETYVRAELDDLAQARLVEPAREGIRLSDPGALAKQAEYHGDFLRV